MKSVLIILVVALAGANARLTLDLDPRIVNGVDVKPGEIPYQVSLQKNNRHFCGGSVLNANYVLTAAHCVDGQDPNLVKVIAGTVNLQSSSSVHQVEKFIPHEKYQEANSWMNDIALIKVKQPFVRGPQISFVPLPKANEVVPAGAPAIVSGWGRLRQNGPTTVKMQKAQISIVSQDACSKAYGKRIFDSQICANDARAEKGACNGDSGGPLTVNGKIVGIVSWSRGCALSSYPTVYTRVTSYLDWIQRHTV